MQMDDPIAALSTAPGYGAIAVVRLSGQDILSIIKNIFVPSNKAPDWKSHQARLGWIIDEGQMIDQVMMTWMKAPHSYTGEDCIEISCHGSPVIAEKILQLLYRQGARVAEPGEFTKRAFLNGKMDLSQAESVMELISSHSEMAAQLSLGVLEGKFSDQLQSIKQQTIELLAYVEAFLDFPEEDLPEQNIQEIKERWSLLLEASRQLQKQSKASKRLRRGVEIVLLGPANAGKSSLFNAILGAERAIVSHHAGTTRDFIDAEIIHEGYLWRFIDTAGLREDAHEVEQSGQMKGIEKSKQADIVLFMVDASQSLNMDALNILKQLDLKKVILVQNKRDLSSFKTIDFKDPSLAPELRFAISAHNSKDINLIMDEISNYIKKNESKVEDKWLLSERQQSEVGKMISCLMKFNEGVEQGLSHEFLASDLREMLGSLQALLGEDLSEQVIDEIFSRFCLGK